MAICHPYSTTVRFSGGMKYVCESSNSTSACAMMAYAAASVGADSSLVSAVEVLVEVESAECRIVVGLLNRAANGLEHLAGASTKQARERRTAGLLNDRHDGEQAGEEYRRAVETHPSNHRYIHFSDDIRVRPSANRARENNGSGCV
jgi:hypothetical protein